MKTISGLPLLIICIAARCPAVITHTKELF